MGVDTVSAPVEKSQSEEHSSGRRGWLNWLSRGMLGAGGTDDSSQFSGVISDEVVKVDSLYDLNIVKNKNLKRYNFMQNYYLRRIYMKLQNSILQMCQVGILWVIIRFINVQ